MTSMAPFLAAPAALSAVVHTVAHGVPAAVVAVPAAAVGLMVGSFLNVVVHRVPLGESVVKPRSRCPGCGTELAWYDNVPVVSWLVLRGRCRTCGRPISVRYPVVELLTAVVFGLFAWRLGAVWELPAFLYLAAAGIALAAIDLDVQRLPDRIVLPSYVVTAVLLGAAGLVERDWSALLRAAIGGAALFAFYDVLAFVKPSGMGLGDVKLSGVLGMYLGWLSWGTLLVGGFLGFLIGGLVGLVLILAGRAGRKSRIPYGPFMVAGAFVGVLLGTQIAHGYLQLLGR